MFRLFLVVTIFISINGLSIVKNNSSTIISKYAKVARWGTRENKTQQESSRSHKAQSIWTPRSSSSSNVKNQVVRQYPVYRKVDKTVDNVPGIGEVIQDRFQVRPYFEFGKSKDSGLTYLPPNTNQPATSIVRQGPLSINVPPIASSTSTSFNIPVASSTPQVPSNLYDSPYSSYNPPLDKSPDTTKNVYPPNFPISDSDNNDDASFLNSDSYANVPSSNDGPYNYQPKPSASTSKPPIIQPPITQTNDLNNFKEAKPNHNGFYDDIDMDHSHEYTQSDKKPSIDYKPSNSNTNGGPPNYPPKSIDDVYYPPDFPTDQISDDHKVPDKIKSNGDMSMDLVPPTHDQDFPKYLYDSHHYDHHVYEEVHHTTTPAPEKKRVSTTNYSYYYLGRKLWYIPLYFSIYFMVYVTALIIKSIARHKVTLRNDWITANSRNSRSFPFEHIETIDNIHRNVSLALDKAGKLYSDLSM